MENYLIIYGKPRFLGYLSLDEVTLERGAWVHAQTDRGEELVAVIGKPREDFLSSLKSERSSSPRGHSEKQHPQENPIQKVDFIARASQELLEERKSLEKDEAEILSTARKILRKHDLAMKLVDAEFLMGKKKLFLYFTSEDRVDFRSYVRDLAREFKTRIELRQIGIRDEARVVGGLASCGRPCCCSYWLQQFSPICIRMVKEQNLALNPTKISGICGRLMCCMSYEHFMYKDLWDHLPNPGTKIRGPESTYVLSGVDICSQSARIFGMGREIIIPVDMYAEFCATIQAGKEWGSDSPPPPRKNPFPSPASREGEKKEIKTPPSQGISQKPSGQRAECPEEDPEKDSPKKKLQRRKKGSQTKTLGTGTSPGKKEEFTSVKKQVPSGESRKERGEKRKGEASSPRGEGTPNKKGQRASSPKNPTESSSTFSEGKERKKGTPVVNSSLQTNKEEASSNPNRKRRRRPRKSFSHTGETSDAKAQRKTPREGKPQEQE